MNGSVGTAIIWTIDGTAQTGGAALSNPGPAWHVRELEDFNGDGNADILWQADDGTPVIWTIDGTTQTGGAALSNPGAGWHIV